MNITLFLSLLTIGSGAIGLITEAIKKGLDGTKLHYSSNLVVLIVSIFVGLGGTAAFYQLMSIPFNANNIICMCLVVVADWVGAMVGYDKVKQLITQLGA